MFAMRISEGMLVIEEGRVGGGEVGEVLDIGVVAAEGLQVTGERVDDGLAAARCDRPTGGVACCGEDEACGGAGDAGEREDGVRGDAGEEGARALVLKERGGKQLRGHEGRGAEDGHLQGVAGEAQQGLGEVFDELGPVADGGAEE